MNPADTERAVRAWATAEHTLHDGHDCIRCQVARLLAAQYELIASLEDQLVQMKELLREHELTVRHVRSDDDDD